MVIEMQIQFLFLQSFQPQLAGRIRVDATHNVPVANVSGKILNEQGEAASSINDPWWEFETVTFHLPENPEWSRAILRSKEWSC